MAEVSAAALEEARRRFREDYTFYPERCLKIVTKAGDLVPFRLKRPQERLARGLMAQREAGEPQRAIILKSRQVGFCCAPETRVLTADLRWVTLDEITVGEQVVAVDESIPGGRGRGRKMRRGEVQAKFEVFEPAFRITLDTGEVVVATGPHRFLSRRRGATDTVWKRVDEMEVGTPIRFITRPWGEATAEDGWLGGILDGEGSCHRKSAGGASITITQNPGIVFDRATAYLEERGYVFRRSFEQRERGPIGRLALSRTDEMFRLVGQTRPSRFTVGGWWEDTDLPGKRSGVAWAHVVRIEPLGKQRMIDLQTSHGTYIAEGLVSHNSTLAQGLMIQRATQTANHHALIVAQDTKTVGSILRMGRRMWRHLPADVKPPLVGDRNGRGEAFMHFGEPSRMLRSQGLAGLDSLIEVGSAREVDAGRGITPHSLHLSEVAFWRSSEKMLALKNAVPEVPGSLILEESTANGHNWFRDDWHAAVAGESGYLAIFTPWFEEDEYRIAFPDSHALESFAATIGHGKYGDDEPELMRLIPERIREWEAEWGDEPLTDEHLRVRVLEHLAWRRRTIASRCEGDVDKFHQEYPSTPDEAFLSTGRRVFPAKQVGAIITRCDSSDPVVPTLERPGPARGGFVAVQSRQAKVAHGGTIEVPTLVKWVSARELEGPAPWKLWQLPDPGDEDAQPKRPPGRYIAGVDVMSGEEDEEGTLARHAIEIIDHRSLRQVAEYDSQDDTDTLALEVLKAAIFFHHAIIGVEITGGWGIPVVNRLARGYRYPRVFRRSPSDKRMVDPSQRLGWSTDVATKPLMEARGIELVREGLDGIVSRELAAQMLTYIRDARGRSKPEPGKLSDRLMAWLIAETIATIAPVPTRDIHGSSSSTGGGTVRATVSA